MGFHWVETGEGNFMENIYEVILNLEPRLVERDFHSRSRGGQKYIRVGLLLMASRELPYGR